jgi:hypothetical protein
MVGGVLIAALGERWGFGANAASYFRDAVRSFVHPEQAFAARPWE